MSNARLDNPVMLVVRQADQPVGNLLVLGVELELVPATGLVIPPVSVALGFGVRG